MDFVASYNDIPKFIEGGQSSAKASRQALEWSNSRVTGCVSVFDGATGAQGAVGMTGAQGAVGLLEDWSSYRGCMFDQNRADVSPAGRDTSREIAAYIAKKPSLKVGIDGSMSSNGSDARNRKLAHQRVLAVRDSLTEAGVPESRKSDWRLRRSEAPPRPAGQSSDHRPLTKVCVTEHFRSGRGFRNSFASRRCEGVGFPIKRLRSPPS